MRVCSAELHDCFLLLTWDVFFVSNIFIIYVTINSDTTEIIYLYDICLWYKMTMKLWQ